MRKENLKVLILGSGGREHALVNACLRSPLVAEVFAAPGNGGMDTVIPCHPVDVENVDQCVALAKSLQADLVIVGPEVPLVAGVADALRAEGILVYGPNQKGADLEGSKAVCKAFLERYQIPTAAYGEFSEVAPALAYLQTCSLPIVVKASGLAAGKGVLICETLSEAEAAVKGMLEDRQFGKSGEVIVIEEFLDGEEASLMVLISGDQYVCLPPSQDHKRIGEGDTGLNTGGMGAYAPTNAVNQSDLQQIERTIIKPTINGFKEEGIDFRGTLFVGIMMTPEGPKVLEYNVRFGDPECQVLLPLCETDPISLLYDCAAGTLQPQEVKLKSGFAVIIVLAAKGYPEAYPKGDLIHIPQSLPANVEIIHAGTKRDENGQILSAGGRVLGVVAQAETLEAATQFAYQVCDQIEWNNKYFRRDIAWRQLNPEH